MYRPDSHPFRHHLQRQGGSLILFMVLVLTGCTHHGEERDKGRFGHEPTSYGHAGTANDIHHRYSQEIEDELRLTDQQKEAFNRNKTDYKKMVVKKTADIRTAEIDLAELLAKDTHDRQAIQKQVQFIGRMKEELMMARIDSLLPLKSLLTKEQYEKFQEILQQRMKHMAGSGPHEGM